MVCLEVDNPFWQFSLHVYRTPGVAEECLEVQDRFGIDVNVVLYAAWLGAVRGIALEAADVGRIDEAVMVWSTEVVKQLRAVRRRLKLMPEAGDQEVQALRKRVAETELVSEQLEQALLYRLTDDVGRSAAASVAIAAGNVAAVLGTRGVDAGAFPMHKLLAASEAARTDRPRRTGIEPA
jgi:uncharacterized protein (TIGR02444 family)